MAEGPVRIFLSAATFVAATVLSGCISASEIRDDLSRGRAQGGFVEGVPFESQRRGLCGPNALASLLAHWGHPASQEAIGREIYDPKTGGTSGHGLWRIARKEGLVTLQVQPLGNAGLDTLVAQGLPVLINLDLGIGVREMQHYVLVVGRDRGRDLWVLQDGRRPDKVVSDAWLAPRWKPRGLWALVAFPPERPVTGLSYSDHVVAAERAGELGCAAGAVRHLEEALRLEPEKPYALNNLADLLKDDPARLGEAEALARRALKSAEKDPTLLPYALDTMGAILQKQGRPDDARRLLEDALARAPKDAPLAEEIRRRLGGG